jgi:hypothetical protein
MHARTLGSAAILALALSAIDVETARAGLMPDGTYEYTLKQGTNTVATSTVSVKRSGSVIALHEAETVMQTSVGAVQLSADESVIAESLTPLSFSSTTVSSGKTQEVKFTYANGSGYFTQNGERLTIPIRMLPGTQAMIVQDQTLVTSFLTLPAVLEATRASAFTVVVPTASRTHAAALDAAAQTRPSTVAAGDVGIGIAAGAGSTAFSVWYDPRTGVVDEIDVPAQSLTISMTKRS